MADPYKEDADRILEVALPLEETRDAIASAIRVRVQRTLRDLESRVASAIRDTPLDLDPPSPYTPHLDGLHALREYQARVLLKVGNIFKN